MTEEDRAFEKAKTRMLEIDDYFPFDGSDYCEDCAGWDGLSRRCECGNRRVEWVKDEDWSVENFMNIHAEAY